MIKTILTSLILLLSSFSISAQELSGEWLIVDLQNADAEEYLEVKWEFTETQCFWKSRFDDGLIVSFSYKLQSYACEGAVDGDQHLALENEDGKQCYVLLGIENKNGRITMALIPYGEMEPILLVKK